MREFDDFQKKIIEVLAKTNAPAKIDLKSILVQFIPDDMFIGVEDHDNILQKICFIQYKEGQIEYVHGILSTRISSFINLIDELVKNDYLIKELITEPFFDLKIGKPSSDFKNHVRYTLGSNLSYDKMHEIFVLSNYYTTENLIKLPKYNFLDFTNYIAFKQLKWTRCALIFTATTILIDILFKIIDLVNK